MGSSLSRIFPARDMFSWRRCRCIAINTKVDTTPLDRQLCLDLPDGLPRRQQLVGIAMVILPCVRESRANFEVSLEIRSLFVGVDDEDVIINTKALGFYPYRVKLRIEREMGSSDIVLHDSRDGAGSSRTHTTSSNDEIGAQLNLWPVSVKVKKTWGRSLQDKMEYESIIGGGPGNTAQLEWKLLRWNHNGKKYNPSKPRSLKPPLRRGRTSISVEDFPTAVWYLPPSMASKFPLRFKLHLEAEMHLVWYVKRYLMYRKANCTSETVKLSHEFVVTDGE